MTQWIDPTGDQIKALAQAAQDDGGPVLMLNLLRFRAQATGDGEGMTGAEAYGRYAQAAAPYLQRVGGRVLQAAAPQQAVIGPDGEWDLVAVVEYPSRAAFLEMVADPGYQAITGLRTGALADSRLIACAPATFG